MSGSFQRGEVWLIDFDPVGGQRPGLIVSTDGLNSSAGDDLFAIPISSKFRAVRSRIAISSPEGGLDRDSFILCEKMRSLSKKRFKKRLGRVSDKTLKEIETILKWIFDLD